MVLPSTVFLNIASLSEVFEVFFWVGVIIGAGAVFFTYVIYISAIENKILTNPEFRYIRLGSKIVWSGIVIVAVAKLMMLTLDPGGVIEDPLFLALVTILVIIILNAFLFWFIQLSLLATSTGIQLNRSSTFRKKGVWVYMSWALALASWFAIVVLAVLETPFEYNLMMAVYVGLVMVALVIAMLRWQMFIAPRYMFDDRE